MGIYSLFQAPRSVGSAELREREHENKTAGNWGENGVGNDYRLSSLPLSFFSPRELFACSPLSESLEQARVLITV